MKRQIVPDVIDGQQALCTLTAEDTAKEAADLMAERRIGAVLIMSEGQLAGILTERDLVFRVLAKGLDAGSTKVGTVMTPDPQTVTPDDSAKHALETMSKGHYRHLPVVQGNEVLGIVSIRDLYEAIRANLEADLQSAETLIYGDQYGSGTAT